MHLFFLLHFFMGNTGVHAGKFEAVVPNLFDLATPFENIIYALDPSHYLQLLRCSNNSRQDKKHYRFTCWIHCIYVLMKKTARML